MKVSSMPLAPAIGLKTRGKRLFLGRRPLRTPPPTLGRFVFVGGLHRSGTSLLRQLLRSDPEASGFAHTGFFQDEGEHLQQALPTNLALGGAGGFVFSEYAHLTEESAYATPEVCERILCAWGAYADLSACKIVEKSPSNLVRARLLQHFFPDALFVFIVRHPVAVALATRKWTPRSLIELLLHWQLAHAYLLGDLPHLRHCVVLRYEDLVCESADGLHALFAPHNLQVMAAMDGVRRDINTKYFKTWSELARPERSVLRRLDMDGTSRHFGYHLTPPYVRALDPASAVPGLSTNERGRPRSRPFPASTG